MAQTLRNPTRALIAKKMDDGIQRYVPFTQTITEWGIDNNGNPYPKVITRPWQNDSIPPHIFGQSHKTRKY